jgi:hypothetical protein
LKHRWHWLTTHYSSHVHYDSVDEEDEPIVLPPSDNVCLFGRTGVLNWMKELDVTCYWSNLELPGAVQDCTIDYIVSICGSSTTVPPEKPPTISPPPAALEGTNPAMTCVCECEVTAPLEKGTTLLTAYNLTAIV